MTYHTRLEDIVRDLEQQLANATQEDRSKLAPRLQSLMETTRRNAPLRHKCVPTTDDDLLFDNLPL